MSNVLITGCSKGIGFESALAFARAGHTVFATMRNPGNAPALEQVARDEHLPVQVSAMDVDSDSSVRNAISALLANAPIDVLINNAGVELFGTVEETSFEQFRAVMETNYFGVLRCTQAVLPHMRTRGSGCIVNVSSVAGRFAFPPGAPYCASKWALEALTEALAGEMKTFNVHVALVEPGIIDTAMARRIGTPVAPSPYRQPARMSNLFVDALKKPVHPALVAATILDVVQSGTWQLRHLVGPDAVPFTQWRGSMNDEAWVDLHAGDDETFFASLSPQ